MIKTTTRMLMAGAAVLTLGVGAASAQYQLDPENPQLPTTGDGAAIVGVLQDVCTPLVEGNGELEPLAEAAGFRQDRRSQQWTLPLSQRPFQIEVRKASGRQGTVCEMRVRYAPGWQGPIIEALNVFRFLHEPQLVLQRNEQAEYADLNRTTNTWDNWDNQGFDGAMYGLVIVQEKGPGGAAISPNYDQALIQYQKRPALPEMIAAAEAYEEAVRQQELQQQQQQQQQQQAPEQPAAQPEQQTQAAPAVEAAPAS